MNWIMVAATVPRPIRRRVVLRVRLPVSAGGVGIVRRRAWRVGMRSGIRGMGGRGGIRSGSGRGIAIAIGNGERRRSGSGRRKR
ncbi:hypothetical protein EMPG_15850 [Blastomyces silverae]|uniref:Uncharacterized protein n=1 Tax=Blastomyces silverae TaxID=2060906 RepID=A0A0H1BHN7_9EURO|nr:hypothetical protein EMPG_15850 [Blastomyces silverae]